MITEDLRSETDRLTSQFLPVENGPHSMFRDLDNPWRINGRFDLQIWSLIHKRQANSIYQQSYRQIALMPWKGM